MNRKFGLAPLLGLIVVFLTACSGSLGSQVANQPSPSASSTPIQSKTWTDFLTAIQGPGLTATEKSAVETCGTPTLASCQTKGEAVFQSIPVAGQGDVSVKTSPAGFARELRDLIDVTKLDHAVQLVNTLIGYKQQIDGGFPADQSALAAQVHGVFPNATQADVNVGSTGTTAVDFTANPEERGIAAFSTRTLKSAKEVGSWLNESTPQSTAAKANVEASIRAAGFGDDEVQRALSGAGYLPIQLKGASQVLGTSYFQAGKVLVSNDWRQAGPGDIYWLFLTKGGSLIVGSTVRGDCGNPGVQQIMLVRPNTPPAVSVEQPPTTTTKTPPPAVCRWNSSLPPGSPNCLQPKSSNARDYVAKATAPIATVPDAPSAPSTVVTQVTSGGGVVDTPTNVPGSPSGVTAPQATPAPTTPRVVPPPATGAQPTPAMPGAQATCVPAPGETTC